MTSYALITPGGELSFASGDWRAPIGPEGANRVRLDADYGAAGWVNDVGLLFPERYPRNVVGSIALVCMGATAQPYAGPVVITGWHPVDEVVGLSELFRRYLPGLVRDIQLAVAGEQAETPGVPPTWCAAVADMAEQIRTTPVLPARLIPLEDRS